MGKFPRECTVCGFKGRFLAFDNPINLGLNIDLRCPRCRGLERHRLIALCDREKNLFEGKELLHFAPEPGMRSYILERKPKRYVTCDYAPDIADLRINIEKIDIADNAFDVVYCSHVLEHVDDSRAIPELYRIVRPGGVVLIMVPLIEGWDRTFIDASKTKNESEDFSLQPGRSYPDVRTRLPRSSESPRLRRRGVHRGRALRLAPRAHSRRKGLSLP